MNTSALLSKAARCHGDRPALCYGGEQLSYAELAGRAAAFGSGLVARGLRAGDRVALFCPNRPELAVALLGAFHAGLVAVPVNAKLHPRELEYILRHAGCRALLHAGDDEAVADAAARAGVELSVTVSEAHTGEAFRAILAAGDAAASASDAAPEDPAWLFYTSGTTGRPKGALLTHRNLLAMVSGCLAEMCDFQPEDVVLHAAPLSHGSGLHLLASVARASRNVVFDGPRFDPDAVLETVARERVTAIAFLAPTMIVRLLDGDPGIDVSSLRRIVYGGAPIHVDHLRAALERFGPILVQLYGQGEAPMTISYLRPQDHDPADSEALSSAGIPRVAVEVRIVDADGYAVAAGESGEIAVRGDVVMQGYWDDPAATERALRHGWLHTGDVGRFDDRGRLFLLERKHDVIISGGTNIYPREVEEVLLLHESVKEAAVFGLPDEQWGESVVAAVVAAPGHAPDPDELIDHCRRNLASFKKPKRVEVLEDLPKSAYGKVLRRELRARLPPEGAAER